MHLENFMLDIVLSGESPEEVHRTHCVGHICIVPPDGLTVTDEPLPTPQINDNDMKDLDRQGLAFSEDRAKILVAETPRDAKAIGAWYSIESVQHMRGNIEAMRRLVFSCRGRGVYLTGQAHGGLLSRFRIRVFVMYE